MLYILPLSWSAGKPAPDYTLVEQEACRNGIASKQGFRLAADSHGRTRSQIRWRRTFGQVRMMATLRTAVSSITCILHYATLLSSPFATAARALECCTYMRHLLYVYTHASTHLLAQKFLFWCFILLSFVAMQICESIVRICSAQAYMLCIASAHTEETASTDADMICNL